MHLWSDQHVAWNSLNHDQGIVRNYFCETWYALRPRRNCVFPFSFGSTTEAFDLESACSSFVGATVFELVAVWTLLGQSACLHGGAQCFPLYVCINHLQVQLVLRVWCMYVCTYIAHALIYAYWIMNIKTWSSLHVCAYVSVCVYV